MATEQERMEQACAGASAADVATALVEVVDTVADRLDDLERRLRTVESKPVGLAYRGVWRAGQSYRQHEGVTHQGSVWCAAGG